MNARSFYRPRIPFNLKASLFLRVQTQDLIELLGSLPGAAHLSQGHAQIKPSLDISWVQPDNGCELGGSFINLFLRREVFPQR